MSTEAIEQEQRTWEFDERPSDADNPCAVCTARMPINHLTAIFGCHYKCRDVKPTRLAGDTEAAHSDTTSLTDDDNPIVGGECCVEAEPAQDVSPELKPLPERLEDAEALTDEQVAAVLRDHVWANIDLYSPLSRVVEQAIDRLALRASSAEGLAEALRTSAMLLHKVRNAHGGYPFETCPQESCTNSREALARWEGKGKS